MTKTSRKVLITAADFILSGAIFMYLTSYSYTDVEGVVMQKQVVNNAEKRRILTISPNDENLRTFNVETDFKTYSTANKGQGIIIYHISKKEIGDKTYGVIIATIHILYGILTILYAIMLIKQLLELSRIY
jgi:hypothetical protein